VKLFSVPLAKWPCVATFALPFSGMGLIWVQKGKTGQGQSTHGGKGSDARMP
jgi:hypothetical protein